MEEEAVDGACCLPASRRDPGTFVEIEGKHALANGFA
jgi:hypothetical protein